MPAKNTVESIREFAAPVAASLGLTLWDTELVKLGSTLTLRFTIDKPEGVGITDCEAFSNAIDPILDEKDPIEASYSLQVTSPGIERELKRPEHFAASLGTLTELKLFAPDENGKKQYLGILTAATDTSATVTPEGEAPVELPFSKIALARLVFSY